MSTTLIRPRGRFPSVEELYIDDGTIIEPIEDGPDLFADNEKTKPHAPIRLKDAGFLQDLVKYAQLRPACIPRTMAALLKHFAMPVARDDDAKVEIEHVRSFLLNLSEQLDKKNS